MPRPLGQHDDVAGRHRTVAVLEEQLPAPSGDELRLLDGVGVAPEPLAGGDREVDGRRVAGARAAVGEEGTQPADLIVVRRVELGEIQTGDVLWFCHRYLSLP